MFGISDLTDGSIDLVNREYGDLEEHKSENENEHMNFFFIGIIKQNNH
jgi:hypothetical protein